MQDPIHPSQAQPSPQADNPAVPDSSSLPPEQRTTASRIFENALLLLIRAYQVTLSPFLGGHCRYEPTCSVYAIQAVQEHGPWRGSVLALKRLLRCHPFVKGGYDPVPPRHPHQ